MSERIELTRTESTAFEYLTEKHEELQKRLEDIQTQMSEITHEVLQRVDLNPNDLSSVSLSEDRQSILYELSEV
jgi:hypothetical protein